MSARSERDKTTGKPKHSAETLQRIAEAREYYQTRTSRRPQGKSREDMTLYHTVTGERRSTRDIIELRTFARAGSIDEGARVVMGLDRELRQVLGI